MLEYPIYLLGRSQCLYHLFAITLELLLWTRNHPLNIKSLIFRKKPLETYNSLFASSKDDNPSVIAPTKYTYFAELMRERGLLNIGDHKDSFMIIYAAINRPMG
jgi:hypothetical protein